MAVVVKNPSANAIDARDGFDCWVRKIPWKRAWQHTLVFSPGESHGQRSPEGHSPWSRRAGHDYVTMHAQIGGLSIISDISLSHYSIVK